MSPLDEAAPRYCSEHATFMVSANRRSIKFFPCGIVSHNSNDVRERYCARCKRFFHENDRRPKET